MNSTKFKKLILVLLSVVLCALVIFGIALGRYSGSWTHDFGLSIKPVADSDHVLRESTTENPLFNSNTRHIVFGNTADYGDVISALSSTEKHVGSDSEDAIYSYYDDATDTTYVLSASIIYFNPDSSGLFKDLPLLESITFDNYSTQKATDMSNMFSGCPLLTELDLTGFQTYKVTDMSYMFNGCEALQQVYATEMFDTEKVTSSGDMFTGCYVLTGGEGTKVYPNGTGETDPKNPLDKSYARIDGLDGEPGYFTDQSAKKKYFRSNELLPLSQNAEYTVNGTSAWFTVANALDSSTCSAVDVVYELRWYKSKNGSSWGEPYRIETGTLDANEYQVEKSDVEPITVNGTVYNYIKVEATTTSFLQEDLGAVYHFEYSDYTADYSYGDGVITLNLATNDTSGEFEFCWVEGITPDNSDPNGIFTTAYVGPADKTANLDKHTVYQFLFFVTDSELLTALENGTETASSAVSVVKN